MIIIRFVSSTTSRIWNSKEADDIYIIQDEYFYPDACIKAAEMFCEAKLNLDKELKKNAYNAGYFRYEKEWYIGYFSSIDSSDITFYGYDKSDSPDELKEVWEKINLGEIYL